jgi:hypothetical protein
LPNRGVVPVESAPELGLLWIPPKLTAPIPKRMRGEAAGGEYMGTNLPSQEVHRRGAVSGAKTETSGCVCHPVTLPSAPGHPADMISQKLSPRRRPLAKSAGPGPRPERESVGEGVDRPSVPVTGGKCVFL